MSTEEAGREAERQAAQTVRKADPWIERLARFGYTAKGVVYVVMGVLSVGVATGLGGTTSGQQGVFATIGNQPFGKVMLGLLVVGLFGYALWRAIQAVADADHEGWEVGGLAKRIGYLGSAALHLGLAISAGRLILNPGGGGSPDEWTATLLAEPFGRALVVTVGLGIVGVGLYQMYQVYEADFEDYLKLGEIDARARDWVRRGGRFGLAARGVVFGIVGGFLVLAALQSDPSQARGIGGALGTLMRQPHGPWLLAVVALGLVAYGLLMVVIARYRRIAPG